MDIVELISALILSLVQSVTEFLPISSSLHVILAMKALSLQVDSSVIGFILFSTAPAILWFYRREVLAMFKTPPLLVKFILIMMPIMIISALIHDYLAVVAMHARAIVVGIGGIGLIASDYYHRKHPIVVSEMHQISYRDAVIISIFQLASLISGTSHFASIIFPCCLLGYSRGITAQLAFLTSLPIAAASFLNFCSGISEVTDNLLIMLIIQIFTFCISMVTIRLSLWFINRHGFALFGYYRIALSIFMISFKV